MKNKPKRNTIQQLEDLKSWSQNPTAYEKKLKAFVRSEDPVPRAVKVAKKPKPKPQYLNGNVIDLKPLIHDPWWLIKPEKPEDEDTSIPIEKKINKRIAKQKRSEGLAYLLGETI